MKVICLLFLLIFLVACEDEPTDPKPEYQCEQMTPENKVEGCKLGDWWNFDLQRCNSTLERCLK